MRDRPEGTARSTIGGDARRTRGVPGRSRAVRSQRHREHFALNTLHRNDVHDLVSFLSLFVPGPLPAHIGRTWGMTCGFARLTRSRGGTRFTLLRAAGAAESGNRSGDPWESCKANWAHLVVRSGKLTGCAGGEARDTPKPNERVLPPGNQDSGKRLLGAPEPEGLRVARSFGFRRARSPSGSFFRVAWPAWGHPRTTLRARTT